MVDLVRAIGLDHKVNSEDEFVILIPDEHRVRVESRRVDKDKVPNLQGMGLRDAVYAVERAGGRPRVYGVGKVSRQDPQPGSAMRAGQLIDIRLE